MKNEENIDLVKILNDCPVGMTLYSPIYGEVYFCGIYNERFSPIAVENSQKNTIFFDKRGRFSNCIDAECMLFPSKDCRDWSQFKAPKPKYKFKRFERVLVRDNDDESWRAALFDSKEKYLEYPYYVIVTDNCAYRYCIPYEGNEHLHGTTNKPKEE